MANWIIRELNNKQSGGPSGVPFAISSMLESRGIGADKIGDFLAENPRESYDPMLFGGLDQAARLILKNLDEGRSIVIYGDYDADGVTSTALLCDVFRCFSHKIYFYVPSRFVDGYGLNNTAIEKIAAEHPACLIVTVDCGSTSFEEVNYAKSLGLDIIVSDHHNFEEGKTPQCLILNPKLSDNGYPFKHLSGCGVAFKLAQGIERICTARGDSRFTKTELHDLLDLVAISTIADVVPLVGENRSLVKYGLKVINERRRRGLAALLDVLDIEDSVDSDKIAYTLAPNINALGRMGTAALGVELLSGSGKSMSQLYDLASNMVSINKERREEQEKTARICCRQIAENNCGKNFIVIKAVGAHEGVAGIVAGNLKEKYYRPVFILTPNEDGSLKGTGRCIPGINLHELMAKHSELFTRFGGHAGACGFSMEEKDLDALKLAMESEMDRILAESPDILIENLYIEKVLDSSEKTLAFAKLLKRLEPFGEANPKPCFCMLGARISNICYLGNEAQHVRFYAKTSDGVSVACILFKRAKEFSNVLENDYRIDIAGELSVNEYNGREKLQLIVKDIRRCV